METAEELVVAARPEGISETEGELDNLQESLDDNAESMSDTSSEMGDIQSRWQGAMSALVTGLVVASAGLLSQVPVLGEAFSGLESLVSSIGYQMDQVLRPVLQPITSGLYDLSGAIFEADGAMGTIIGVIGTIVAVLGTLAGLVLGVAAAFGQTAAVQTAVVAAGKALIGVIASMVATIGAVPLAIAAVVAGLSLLVWYFRDEIVSAITTAGGYIADIGQWFLDLGSKVADVVSDIISDFSGMVTKASGWATSLITDFVEGITSRIYRVTNAATDIVTSITDEIDTMIQNATQWGRDLVTNLVDGIRDKISAAGDATSELADEVSAHLPNSPAEKGPLSDLDDRGPALVEEFAGGIEANVGRLGGASESAAQAASPSDPAGFGASRGGAPNIILDGREMNKSNNRYLSNLTSSRNMNG